MIPTILMILNASLDLFFSYVFVYFFVYNITALSLFWVIIAFVKDSNFFFSFKSLSSNIYTKLLVSVLFLSLAGLPPFLGFLTKMLVLGFIVLCNLNLNILFYFTLILMMLYFYIQNFKILFTINNSNEDPLLKNNFFLNSYFYLITNLVVLFLAISPFSIEILCLFL